MVCMIALANLNYFRPHKSRYLFWLSNVSFMVTTAKYVAGSYLMATELHLRAESEREKSINEDVADKDRVGVLPIVLDAIFLTCCGLSIVILIHRLHGKIRDIDVQDLTTCETSNTQKEHSETINDSLVKISPPGACPVMK